jgi:hypothetical protein
VICFILRLFFLKIGEQTSFKKRNLLKISFPSLKFGNFGFIINKIFRFEFFYFLYLKIFIKYIFNFKYSPFNYKKYWYFLSANFPYRKKSKNSRMGKGIGDFKS